MVVEYFIKNVNPDSAKQLLNFNGSSANLGLTAMVNGPFVSQEWLWDNSYLQFSKNNNNKI